MRIGVGLSIPELSTRGGRFSPASLFTGGVQGAWYDPSDVLLNWRTNLLTYSQEFDNAAWLKQATTATANSVVAPDGTSTADKMLETAVTSQHSVYQAIAAVAGTRYTMSVYGKAAERSYLSLHLNNFSAGATFDLQTGTIVGTPISSGGATASIVDAGNGWYRCSVSGISGGTSTYNDQIGIGLTGTLNSNVSANESYAGDGTSGIYIWGAQLELGSTATAYQAITTPEQTYLLYDPQPVLYQDSSGTTPVTAVEQPVGLMLDKSQGLVLGPELVTGGDFSSGASWTTETGWSVAGGVAVATNVSSFAAIFQSASVVAGRMYLVTFTVSNYSAGQVYAYVGSVGFGSARSSNGTFTQYIFASGIGQVSLRGTNNFTGNIDNFSVKELPGNHASQATAASRPVLRARYNLFTYSEDFTTGWNPTRLTTANTSATTDPLGGLTADKINPNGNVNNDSYNLQYFNSISGTVYTISVYFKDAGLGWAVIFFGSATNAVAFFNLATGVAGSVSGSATGKSSSITSVGNGWYRCTLTCTANITGSVPAGFAPAEADNDIIFATGTTNGVYIWGAQLVTGSSAGTYQRIAAATDYATAGFLPYLALSTDDSFGTNSVNFTGTDKMFVCAGLTKLNTTAAFNCLLEFGASGANGIGIFAPDSNNNNYSFWLKGQSRPTSTSVYVAPITNVISVQHDCAEATAALQTKPRINGASVSIATSTAASAGNFANEAMFIGRRNNATLPFEGRIYQLIVCGKILSASELASTEAYVNARTGAY